MEDDPLGQLRSIVVDDPHLRGRLLAVTDKQAFIAEVVGLARSLAIPLTAGDVDLGLSEARRQDLDRWV
jgi:hypothetical protein